MSGTQINIDFKREKLKKMCSWHFVRQKSKKYRSNKFGIFGWAYKEISNFWYTIKSLKHGWYCGDILIKKSTLIIVENEKVSICRAQLAVMRNKCSIDWTQILLQNEPLSMSLR